MAEYKNDNPCEFIYHITAIEKVVDGDTIDAVIDLGFDVRYCGRIRLLGIDTPESRTRDLAEKFYFNGIYLLRAVNRLLYLIVKILNTKGYAVKA